LVALPAALAMTLVATSVVAATGSASTSATVALATGSLSAGGAGQAKAAGSFVLVGSMDGGWVKVSGLAGPDIVRITGWASRTRLADGSLIFRGVHGTVYVAGRRIAVTLSGAHIRFVATGHGSAFLKGEGTFRLNGDPAQPWSSVGARYTF
jgi:hypothetical protein